MAEDMFVLCIFIDCSLLATWYLELLNCSGAFPFLFRFQFFAPLTAWKHKIAAIFVGCTEKNCLDIPV